jgi:hypothetical protein
MQTSELRYRLERHDIGYSVVIPFTYRNETGGPVTLDQCDGDLRPLLQVRREGRWVDAWRPLQRSSCVDEPVVVASGATRSDTVSVVGAPPGSNVTPQFVFSELEGVYRLYWFQARRDSAAGADAVDPADARWRTSNAFVLSFR